MIAIMGDASLAFSQKEGDIFKSRVSGFGYQISSALAGMGSFPALFCALGSDEAGSIIVEKLVEDEILFDPELVRTSHRTNIEIEYQNGEVMDFFTSSASAYVDAQVLLSALSVHTNIKIAHLCGKSLSVNPASSSYIDQSLFLSPRPLISLDLSECIPSPVLERALGSVMPFADLLIGKKDFVSDEVLNTSRLAVITDARKIKVFQQGSERFSSEMKEALSSPEISARILHDIELSSFLPSDGEDITDHEIPLDLIVDSAGRI